MIRRTLAFLLLFLLLGLSGFGSIPSGALPSSIFEHTSELDSLDSAASSSPSVPDTFLVLDDFFIRHDIDLITSDVSLCLAPTSSPFRRISFYEPIYVVIKNRVRGEICIVVQDTWDVLEEYDQNDQLTAFYLPGRTIDEVCYAVIDGEERYFHRNDIGSVAAVTDEFGEVLQRYDYDVFGKTTVLDPAGNLVPTELSLSPYMFTGRRFDHETGLYYFRKRYYSPELGRFIHPDPLDYVDGMNVYSYVNGNVVNMVDPMGLDSVEIDRGRAFWTTDSGLTKFVGHTRHSGRTTTVQLHEKYGGNVVSVGTLITAAASISIMDTGSAVDNRLQGYLSWQFGDRISFDPGNAVATEGAQRAGAVLVGGGKATAGVAMVIASGGTGLPLLAKLGLFGYGVDEAFHGGLQIGTMEEQTGFVESGVLRGSVETTGSHTAGIVLLFFLDPDGSAKNLVKVDLEDAAQIRQVLDKHGLTEDEFYRLVDKATNSTISSFPAFRTGDSITKITPEGKYPIWFSKAAAEKMHTVQGRYWMNRAASAKSGEFTHRQLAKMRAGFAPERKVVVRNRATGDLETRKVSKELHHARRGRGTPGNDSPLDLYEVWPWEHDSIDQFRHTGYEFIDFVE